MNKSMKKITRQILALAALSVAIGDAMAATYYLRAEQFTQAMPDGAMVTMWGFAQDDDGNFATIEHAATVPGPVLTVPPGDDTLTIQLYNNLPQLNGADVPVSIVIPGQNGTALAPERNPDGRVRSFTHETARTTTGTYTWTGLKPGTYLYQSGTHPALQVQMGLYGAMKKDSAAGQAYPGVSYNRDLVLLFSEVDSALHQAVATDNYGPGKGVTSTINYRANYFLINGRGYPSIPDAILGNGAAGQRVLLRLLNAGYESHAPVLQDMYMSLVAEDGNLLPYAREQYSAHLPAGKTMDAVIDAPTTGGRFSLYDRRLSLSNNLSSPGGMLMYLGIDTDGDTIPDYRDNCTLAANANQRDTNGDGYGNLCDADFNGSGTVNTLDLNILKAAYGTAVGNPLYNPDVDLNGDNKVNTLDLSRFKQLYGKPIGPSCCGQ